MTDGILPRRLGVVGAGTMGSGIAQLGVLAAMETVLHDPVPGALDRGAEAVRRNLGRGAERGRWSEAEAEAAGERLTPASGLDELAGCELVIEAAPERLELKRELFERLSRICGEDAVLATNTSSLLVTGLAGAAARPERVVGMHFFNPAPLMPLLEVVQADQTGERALAVARASGEAMGKRVVVARDGPGFLVNRCGRPFAGEALRALEERLAAHEQIDRICRMGGGFRMGPFELMDLVGIDVGLEVARSFFEQGFGEPRWRPSRTQARMVAAGRAGRKSGRGFYEYAGAGPHRPSDPEPPALGGGDGRLVAVDGEGALAEGLRGQAAAAGFGVRRPEEVDGEEPWLVVDCAVGEASFVGGALGLGTGGPPLLALCAGVSLGERGHPEACGFSLVPPLDQVRLAELTRLRTSSSAAIDRAEAFVRALGMHPEWVADAPGLVLARIVCALVNEAAFALGEGVGSAADVDTGMTLGLNHPRGPVAWSEALGAEHVLGVIDGLWAERREERYRAAPLLRAAVATGRGLREAAG